MSEFSYYYDPDDEGEKYEDEEGYIRKKKIAKTAYQWWIQERVDVLREAENYFKETQKSKYGKKYEQSMWVCLFEWATPDLWCAPSCECERCCIIANLMFEEELHHLGFYHEDDDDD
jgi:hypothetical protein